MRICQLLIALSSTLVTACGSSSQGPVIADGAISSADAASIDLQAPFSDLSIAPQDLKLTFDLVVEVTIDGANDQQSQRCQQYGIGWWSINLSTTSPVPVVRSIGVDCINGIWKTFDFIGIEPGDYTISIVARTGSGGSEIATRSKDITLRSTGTIVRFNYDSDGFDP